MRGQSLLTILDRLLQMSSPPLYFPGDAYGERILSSLGKQACQHDAESAFGRPVMQSHA